MKNVINWTIGSFFRTIGRIIAYIAIGSLILFVFSYKPKAATLTSYDTYTKIMNQESGCGTSNRYSYTQYSNNDPAGDLWQTGSFNTQYSGKAAILYFNFQYNLTAGKYYDIDINFNTSDLSNSLNTTNVYVDSGTSCQDLSGDRVALIGFTLSNSATNYSNKATIRILANSATTYWAIELYKGVGQFVTGVNNWRINSITITEVDPSNTNIVIDNATNNTTNIINNNNENTQQIIDSQNELLGRKCDNLLNKNNYIIDSDGYLGFSISGLQVGKTYTLSSNQSFDYYKFSQKLFGSAEVSGPEGSVWSTSTTFTITDNSRYLFFEPTFNSWITNISQLSNYNLMLVEGSIAKPYCEYGSYSSKLDDTNSAINNLNDTLTDDTTNDTDISNALNNIDVPQTSYGPFQAFLTIPLQWVQTILASGQTCQTLHLPLPFVNRDLDLPCMTDFWTSTGVLGVLIQALWIAVVAVRIFNGLFLLTAETFNTNPDSAMELTKIKSWEL